jgi:hypothetical protein
MHVPIGTPLRVKDDEPLGHLDALGVPRSNENGEIRSHVFNLAIGNANNETMLTLPARRLNLETTILQDDDLGKTLA